MNLTTEPFLPQSNAWPEFGRVILAQYDESSVIVYQAYKPEIGNFAAANGYFGGEFKLSRMSWIKPNFLWMMYRSGWAGKQGQDVVLAVRLKRDAFDTILRLAIHSSFKSKIYESRDHWESAVQNSDVRLQWDPDHAPDGSKLERRAIQLGLRGAVLEQYSREWILEIIDVSSFIHEQRANATSDHYNELIVPSERIYPVTDRYVIDHLRIDHSE